MKLLVCISTLFMITQHTILDRKAGVDNLPAPHSFSVVMLTANDSKSRKNICLLGENVGSQSAERILQELVKLNKFDQLTFKGLHRW
jgi:hypothetical protein